MNVSLTPELEKLVVSKLGSGRYRSADEVVGAALRLLDSHDSISTEQLETFDEGLRRRLESLDRGESVDPEQARMRLRQKSIERRKLTA